MPHPRTDDTRAMLTDLHRAVEADRANRVDLSEGPLPPPSAYMQLAQGRRADLPMQPLAPLTDDDLPMHLTLGDALRLAASVVLAVATIAMSTGLTRCGG